jgi:alpha-glucosidase (family GH31 glycosyl hydrolase)
MDTHSLFGHMSAYASSTWFELNQNNRRKMIIESSAYTGTSRFASRWLGDYISNADYMGYSVTGIMLQSMNGFSMSGPDVCGFFGDATGELCARWYTVAAFQPFARNHNTYNTAAQEPYVFDKEIYDSTITYMDIIKHSMQTRLNMIRYMYSSTILDMHFGNEVYYQPLFFQFPADAKAYSASQQNNVMLGKHMKLSVLSNMVDQNTTSFYFPAGTWCNMFQNVGNQACFTSTGEDKTLPTKAYNYYVHLKENSIVPMQNVTFLKELYPAVAFTSTTDMQSQAVEFHIHPNASGNATGNYYNDDGETETGNVGTFNVYSLDLYLSQVDGSVTFNVTTIHEATNYPNSAVNENDVLGQVHIYNAEGLGLNKNWQSEVHYKTGEVVSLLIAEYQPYVDRVVLPPMYLYLPSIDFIKFIPIV